MYTYKELRKAAKQDMAGTKYKVAVLGNCATQFFSTSLLGYANLSGFNIDVFEADYNQVEAQLLNQTSEVYSFTPNAIILLLATEKLYEEFLDKPLVDRRDFAEEYIAKIKNYWRLIESNTKACILQCNFTEINDFVLGQYSAKIDSTFIYQLRKLNFLLQEAMNITSNVYPVDLLSIQNQLGQDIFYDAAFYYKAKMSISTKALPYVAKSVIDVLKSLNGKSKKCVVLDLDNTLWGGVIGDDGVNNIEIGELGRGHVFTNFQKWLKQLKEMGIILAVCSKNNEEIAKEPFIKNEEMVLKLDDISVFIANWEDKSYNIKMIQECLNIGMDSIVFIDDNPFERDCVKQMIPEVIVPDLPEDPADYLTFMQKCNLFDTISYLEGKQDRTKMYQAECERRRIEFSFASIDEYLSSLEMVGYVGTFEESKYSRIAELTQRSNQFNLRTIRYTEADIKRLSEDDQYITLYYTLKDKFGDYGLVGVIIMEKQDENALFIDTWLMSCRVLKRGMEEYIINNVIQEAKSKGFTIINAEYIPTRKNMMVSNIYSEMGFSLIDENKYRINVNDYIYKKVYIMEEQRE